MKPTSDEHLPYNMNTGSDWPNLRGVLALASEQAWPYLKAAGLPEYLVENPEVMRPIYERLRHKYCVAYSIIDEQPNLVQELMGEKYYYGDYHRWAGIKLWHGLLEQLAELSSRDVAIEFDRWSRRHWFSGEQINRTMDVWKSVLQALTATDEYKSRIEVPIPDSLKPLIPELRKLVSYEISDNIIGWSDIELLDPEIAGEAEIPESKNIYRLVGSGLTLSLNDQWSYDHGHIRIARDGSFDQYDPPCFYTSNFRPDFECFTEVIIRDGIFQALRLLAIDLSPSQKESFVRWAEQQAKAALPGINEYLYGDTYLRTNFLFHDSPSMLDMRDTDFPEFWVNLNWL